MPQSPPDWYDDPDGSGGQRWWDGRAWTTQRRKRPPSNPHSSPQFGGSQLPEQQPYGASSGPSSASGYGPLRSFVGRLRLDPHFRKKTVLTGSGLVVAIIIAVVLASWWADRRAEQRLWSLLPHTMGCIPDPYLDWPMPPGPVKAQQVGLEHLGERRIAVSVTFSEPPPPAPVLVRTAYGELRNRPGSLSYWISVEGTEDDASVVAYSPTDGDAWRAVMISGEGLLNSDERPEIPLQVSTFGNVLRLVLDLADHPQFLNDQPFAPPIMIASQMADRSELMQPEEVGVLFKDQLCDWSTPIAATPGPVARDVPAPRQTAAPAPRRIPTPTAAPDNPCEADAESALRQALSQLGSEPTTGADWSRTPIASNFNPCTELSTILVTVEGGTGSSPMQALMFHRGRYLGTGTLEAYPFTSLDTQLSTNDTVVLRYRTGQSCTGCNDGLTTTVRYYWDGNSVQMLDPPPPTG